MVMQKSGSWYVFKLLSIGALGWGCVSSIEVHASLALKKMRLDFDTPVREGWFQKALNACMHAWGDVRALVIGKKESDWEVSDDQDAFLMEGMIGRVMYAYFCLEKVRGGIDYEADDIHVDNAEWSAGVRRGAGLLRQDVLSVNTNAPSIKKRSTGYREHLAENFCYLDRVLEKIAAELVQLSHVVSNSDHIVCAQDAVALMRSRLQSYLQSEG